MFAHAKYSFHAFLRLKRLESNPGVWATQLKLGVNEMSVCPPAFAWVCNVAFSRDRMERGRMVIDRLRRFMVRIEPQKRKEATHEPSCAEIPPHPALSLRER